MEGQEHLSPEGYTQWAAERAFQILETGDLKRAIDSMVSDLAKDPTTVREQQMSIGMMGMSLRNNPELNEQMVRKFIEGFPGVPKRSKVEMPKYEVPQYKKPELSEEDRINAEDFINKFILRNDGLTPAAKELVVNSVRTERGPWSLKDVITGVTQQDNKITIRHKNGEAYLYIGK